MFQPRASPSSGRFARSRRFRNTKERAARPRHPASNVSTQTKPETKTKRSVSKPPISNTNVIDRRRADRTRAPVQHQSPSQHIGNADPGLRRHWLFGVSAEIEDSIARRPIHDQQA